ncbi:hypothetical protein [Engelhardtia mirabilis]|uniref:Uncharacterized protein n=1 Tax=Engelhardtia mirabilis TaxID=2528011 RepID=A0A518BL40_9BACT|nr:hypothetical protein Pla133_27790 [Planctomycetes bacterium Pla133]QDV02017.1 hypothetical protein Pla86_27780 [Planctomycetes bacterium Pla86]
MGNDDLIERARAALDGVTDGPWTLNDRALAPVHWPEGCTHLSDVAFAHLNVEHEDRETCVNALVFAAQARTLVPALADALKASNARVAELEQQQVEVYADMERARNILTKTLDAMNAAEALDGN